MLIATALFTLLAADPVAASRQYQQEARAAYQAKDHAAFLQKIRAASDLRPQHPTLLYQLAGALALNGRKEEALQVLERVAAMGMVYAPEKQPDFASLAGEPRLAAIVERFQRNAQPMGTASRAFVVRQPGLIPEGLAFDPRTGRYFLGSVREGNIRVLRRDGSIERTITLPRGVFGMAVDPKRRILYAATSSLPQYQKFQEAERDQGAVVAISLRDWSVTTLAAPPGKHQFGDVAVASDGTLYASDGATNTIYRLSDGELRPFSSGPFIALQGITVSPRGHLLYAADYSKGLFAVDARTGDAHLLGVPDDVSLLGVDGLYAAEGETLIATQNGTNPHRILRIGLDGLRVVSAQTLAANHGDFEEPTLGVLSGRDFLFNANAQWGHYGEDGKVKDEKALKEAVILRVRW